MIRFPSIYLPDLIEYAAIIILTHFLAVKFIVIAFTDPAGICVSVKWSGVWVTMVIMHCQRKKYFQKTWKFSMTA